MYKLNIIYQLQTLLEILILYQNTHCGNSLESAAGNVGQILQQNVHCGNSLESLQLLI